MYNNDRQDDEVVSIDAARPLSVDAAGPSSIDAARPQVLPAQKVRIGGIDYKLDTDHSTESKKSEEKMAVADSMRPTPDQDAPNHILNMLCDDVLRMIFEDPRHGMDQLIVIANVCTTFHRIAGDIFKARHKGQMYIYQDRDTSIWAVNELLRTFGSLISTISLNFCVPLTMVLATKYCNNIETMKCSSNSRSKLILSQCNFPKLVNLHLSNMDFDDLPSAEAFFKLNPQLEELALQNISMTFNIKYILRHLPNLIILSLELQEYDCNDVEYFKKLKHLKSLRFKSIRIEQLQRILNKLVAGRVQLERLELNGCTGNNNEMLNTLCRIKSINWLQIHSINDSSLIPIIRNLENLAEIHIKQAAVTIRGVRHALENANQLTKATFQTAPPDRIIDISDIDAIAEVRKNRSMDVKLQIRIYEHLTQVSIMNRVFILYLNFALNCQLNEIYEISNLHRTMLISHSNTAHG